jgi:hypothetical protein
MYRIEMKSQRDSRNSLRRAIADLLRYDPRQVEHRRSDPGLREHVVDLAAMMRLVVEEMNQQHPCRLPI